jgi:hypothetical protein
MELRGKGKLWFMMFVVGLLAAFAYLIYQSGQLRAQPDQLRAQIAALSKDNQMLKRKNEQLSYIHFLSVEFSMDPTIVALVDHSSREHMKNGGPEWKLVRTPEFMSYVMLSLIYAESKGNTKRLEDSPRSGSRLQSNMVMSRLSSYTNQKLILLLLSNTSTTCSKNIEETSPLHFTLGIVEAARSTNFCFMVSHPKTVMLRKSTRLLSLTAETCRSITAK